MALPSGITFRPSTSVLHSLDQVDRAQNVRIPTSIRMSRPLEGGTSGVHCNSYQHRLQVWQRSRPGLHF